MFIFTTHYTITTSHFKRNTWIPSSSCNYPISQLHSRSNALNPSDISLELHIKHQNGKKMGSWLNNGMEFGAKWVGLSVSENVHCLVFSCFAVFLHRILLKAENTKWAPIPVEIYCWWAAKGKWPDWCEPTGILWQLFALINTLYSCAKQKSISQSTAYKPWSRSDATSEDKNLRLQCAPIASHFNRHTCSYLQLFQIQNWRFKKRGDVLLILILTCPV